MLPGLKPGPGPLPGRGRPRGGFLWILALVLGVPLLLGRAIVSGQYFFIGLCLFTIVILFLYFRQFEVFVLLTLVMNHNFFDLFPSEPLGKYNYASLLLIVIFLTFAALLVRIFVLRESISAKSGPWIIAFLALLAAGVLGSSLRGQPFTMGLKQAIFIYGSLLLYFVFASRRIDVARLLDFFIITGIVLSLLNNVQYLFFGRLQIFQMSEVLFRSGHLRLLFGDFFTILAPLAALSQYLAKGKRLYLGAFLYMTATVVMQGQTRAIIMGFLVATILCLFIAGKINLKKALLIGIPSGVIVFLMLPVLETGRIADVYRLTVREIANREGNWGGRIEAYEYYLGGLSRTPVFGKGIWNENYPGTNPEERSPGEFGLPDIGIMALVYRFGLAGLLWLVLVLRKFFRSLFSGAARPRGAPFYFVSAYLFFSLTTLLTIDCLTQHRTIIYLALSLALLDQMTDSRRMESPA